MMLRMFMVFFLLSGPFFSGCRRVTSDLDAEIAALPRDTWTALSHMGASSNNYEILNRVSAVPDVQERIRLVRVLRDHFRRSPEWMVTNGLCSNWHCEQQRRWFLGCCDSRLAEGTNVTAAAIRASWRMKSEYLDDLEKMIELAEDARNDGAHWKSVRENQMIRIARDLRWEYERYFRYQFGVLGDYQRLPPADRPAFVDQIKRDFFGRKGMVFVDKEDIPEAFKK